MFKLTLKANEKEYVSEAETFLGALDGFGLHFMDIKTKGSLAIEKDGKLHERPFPLFSLRRLFLNSAIRKLLSLQVEEFFKMKYPQAEPVPIKRKRGRPRKQ